MGEQDPLSTSDIPINIDSYEEEEEIEIIAIESDYDILDVEEECESSSEEEDDSHVPRQLQDFIFYVESSSDEEEIDALMDIENDSLPQVFASPLPPVASSAPHAPSPLQDLSSPPPVVPPTPKVSSPPSDPDDWDTPLITRLLRGKPLWTRVHPPEPPIDIRPTFICSPGPRHTHGCKTPADYIQLFLTTAIIDNIVRATNAYAARSIQSMKAKGMMLPQSRMKAWVDVTRSEIWKYLSMLLAMGLIPKHHYSGYWSKPHWQHKFIPFFSETMSLRRFELITSAFQVVESPQNPPCKGEPNYDPWVRIRGFYDAMNNAFKRHFVPHQEICIDESTIGTKARGTSIQKMPNKRYSRRGILKYELCDSRTCYILMSLLYPAKGFLGDSPDPFTEKVVRKLLTSTRLLKKGYHLFTDNFYTKVRLANFLKRNNTYLTGTINPESSLLSKEVNSAVLQTGQSIYFRSGKLLLVKYKERKSGNPVHVISTAIHAEDLPVVSKSGLRKVKPVLIDRYSHFMGGVDCKDKSIYHLPCSRMTKKYWKKIVYNFIDMAVFNAHVLFVKDTNKKMPRERFIDEIVKYFCYNDANPVSPIRGPGSAPVRNTLPNHGCESLPGRNKRKCVVCSKKGHKWCPGCNVGIHLHCYPRMKHFTGVAHKKSNQCPSPGRV